MGYYTGSGVVVGGGVQVTLKESVYWYGQHNVYQRTTSTTTRKNGVSLATAQASSGDASMSNMTWTSGMVTFNSYNCKGSNSSSTYSRIGDSSLYVLDITQNTIQAKEGLNWSPSGWQS